MNTKIGLFENKISNYAKYITTPEFNKFTSSMFDQKIKQANLATNSDVNAVEKLSNKNKEKIKNCTHLI